MTNETVPNKTEEIQSIVVHDVPRDTELDIQVATARRFPRSLQNFQKNAMTRATLDQATAESCYYVIPRDGKTIEGPSIRFAEICAGAWQNCRWGGRVVAIEEKSILCEGFFWDLENNLAVKVEVRRKITNKQGKRYSEDMVNVTGNAGIAIAMRNAVFKIIPRAYTDNIMARVKQVSAGDAKALSVNRVACLDGFAKLGVRKEQVFKFLDKKGVEDVDLEDLATLRGVYTAIKDGDTTVEEAFPDSPTMPKRASEKGTAPEPQVVPPTTEAPSPEVVEPKAATPRLDRLRGLCKERGVPEHELEEQLRNLLGNATASAEVLLTPQEENELHKWIMGNRVRGGK